MKKKDKRLYNKEKIRFAKLPVEVQKEMKTYDKIDFFVDSPFRKESYWIPLDDCSSEFFPNGIYRVRPKDAIQNVGVKQYIIPWRV
jgi:hypothetical protein